MLVSNAALALVRSEPRDQASHPVEAMFQFLGTNVRVVSASVPVIQHWTARYGAFRIPPGPADITVRVNGEGNAAPVPGQVTIEWDGLSRTWQGLGTVLPPLATPPLDRWTYLHGAAVARAGHAVVLIGGPRTGKTLLALTLVARGAKLLADGLLPLDADDLLLAPFLEALRLRREELEQLGIPPAHPALVPLRTPAGAIEWRADPAGLLGQRAGRVAAGAAAVVVLQPSARAGEPRLQPLSPEQALQQVRHHLHRPAPDSRRTRPALARLCQKVPAFTLVAGPPDRTARLLDELLA
jgi:hypothetical protein